MASPTDLPSLYPLLLAYALMACRTRKLPEDIAEDLMQELYVRTEHLLDTTRERAEIYAFLRRQLDWMVEELVRMGRDPERRDGYMGHLWRGNVSLDDLTEKGLL